MKKEAEEFAETLFHPSESKVFRTFLTAAYSLFRFFLPLYPNYQKKKNRRSYDTVNDRIRKSSHSVRRQKINVEIKSLNSKAMDLSTRIAPLYREKKWKSAT